MFLKNFTEKQKDYQKTVQLFITQRCNFKCDFCFRSLKHYQISEMSFLYAKAIIDKFVGTNSKISFTGGEPALHLEFEKMLEYCAKLGIDSEVFSNGTLDFNNFKTKVKLRYDGFDSGLKLMNTKKYSGPYELGLLINGINLNQLIKCVLATRNDEGFTGVIQIAELVGDNDLPVCGIQTYSEKMLLLAQYVGEECPWVKIIEICVGSLGVNTNAPKCRFERYYNEKKQGTCPKDRDPNECDCCLFQKQIFIRNP